MSIPLFVYGTLKRNGPRKARALLGSARFLGTARIRGTLYDLGKYPGLVQKPREQTITGELYDLSSSEEAEVLKRLDRYEGSQFARRRAFVTLSDGRRRGVWVYVLRTKPKGAATIVSGIYRPTAA